MTRVYEALMNAQIESEQTGRSGEVAMVALSRRIPPRSVREGALVAKVPTKFLNTPIQNKMFTLYHEMTAILDNDAGHVIQFVGIDSPQASTLCAREFSKTLAFHLKKHTLLLDANPAAPSLARYHIQGKTGWADCLNGDQVLSSAIHRIEDRFLYVSALSVNESTRLSISAIPEMEPYFDMARRDFDWTIMDSPGGAEAECVALAKQADGVILVIESEKTRRFAARDMRDRLLSHGVNVLGVVLSDRRYFIPSFIYRML